MSDQPPGQRDPGQWDDDERAAEYVIGVLPAADRVAFAGRLSADQVLQQRVRFWNEKLDVLTYEVVAVTPPVYLWRMLEARLFGPQSSAASLSDEPAQGWWNSLVLWRGLTGASLAALAIVAGLYAGQLRSVVTAPGEMLVSEVAGESNLVRLAAVYEPATGVLRVNRTVGTRPAGRDFELWLIAGNNAPVSLGVLPEEATGRFTIAEDLRPQLRDGTLAISDEPAGGSPTGQPTGSVIATGKISAI